MDYTKTIIELEAIKSEWLKNIEHINSTIMLLKRVTASSPELAMGTTTPYIPRRDSNNLTNVAPPPLRKISKAEKIVNTIINLGRFVPRNEVERAGGFDNNIAANLSTNDKVVNYKDGRNSYWGLKEWMGDDGKPKNDYKPLEKSTNAIF